MWCPTCQQDVALAAGEDTARPQRCELCGGDLAGRHAKKPGTKAPIPAALPLADDWELEADLRGVERLLVALKSHAAPPEPSPDQMSFQGDHWAAKARAHAAHEATSGWHSGEPKQSRSNPLAWTILSLGLATFACGAVLLGWSFAAERDDLWPLGLPLALVGQAGLIVGLVLQIEGLWQGSRHTAETLSELDEELTRVRQATRELTKSHSPGARSLRDLWTA